MALTHRQNEILSYLKKNKFAKITELANMFFISTATVRRELIDLEKMGLLNREHGGAVFYEMSDEIAMVVRQRDNVFDKEQTAALAVQMLPPFKTVFIDNSSTAMILANLLNFKHKTVVTNGLMLALELSKDEEINVLLPPGKLGNGSSLTGVSTVNFIKEMRFNLVIMSATSVNANGAYESSIEQAEIKKATLESGNFKVLIADKYKFNDSACYKTASLKDFDCIFTNADDETIAPLKNIEGVKFINS